MKELYQYDIETHVQNARRANWRGDDLDRDMFMSEARRLKREMVEDAALSVDRSGNGSRKE